MVKLNANVKIIVLLVIGLSSFFQLIAQNNGLLQRNDLEDTYRILQLTDTSFSKSLLYRNRSFIIRPIDTSSHFSKKNNWIELSNISYSSIQNDDLAMGYNNESFYPAAGMQNRYSVGLRAQFGRISISLQPELVKAENKEQAEIDPSFSDADFFSRYYYSHINVIDMPSRFGTKPLQKLYPGQSSIKYNFNQFAFGISTENMWWGPGMYNSLVLTNNAPGFLHLTLNTNKPIETKVGTFEGQLIYGILDSSGIEPVENVRQRNFWAGAYVPRVSSAKRNLIGHILTWQPKWVPNLYIGFASTYYFYANQIEDDPNAYYPYTASSQSINAAALGSIFARYAMPKDKAEVYLEIGRADKPANIFNLIGDTIPLGYTAGFRKLFKLNVFPGFIEFSGEVTRLELPDPRLIFYPDNPLSIRKTKSWYTNPKIRQGYTNEGQLLGAGIGPGSNSQRADISWVNGFNKIGVHGERVVHDNDFYYYQYLTRQIGYAWANRYWVDLTYGFHTQLKWKKFIFAGLIDFSSALNYKWVKVNGDYDGPSSISDKVNKRITLSLTYQLSKKMKINFPKYLKF